MSETPRCLPAYIDSSGCTVTPACPGAARVPAYVMRGPVLGWNAGANSIKQLDGGLRAAFTMPTDVAGVVIGLRSGRSAQTRPELIEHGFYMQSIGGVGSFTIMESGKRIGANRPYTAATVFTVRRADGRVTYLVDGLPIHTSAARSTGVKLLNTCLYASGDSV